jgi:DNA-binding transcriptional LysR family regulator
MISGQSWFIRARLRTRHLMLLAVIGEEGNIHKAAELMNMSQPAASRLLSDLEEIVGTPLFDRLPRGVKANWYGETLIRHARIALASLEEASTEIEEMKAGRAGHVNVGSISGPAIGLVPRAVANITRKHPMVKVHLQVDSSDRLLEYLQAGKLDMMVGRLLDRHDKTHYTYQKLADEPVCAAVRNGHPLLTQDCLDMEDLARANWIVPPAGSVLRHRFDLMFREAGFETPKQLIETVSPMVVTRLLEETDYVSVLACEVAQYYASCGLIAVLPITLSCNMDSFGVIMRKGWLLSPAARIVLEALEQSAVESLNLVPALSGHANGQAHAIDRH